MLADDETASAARAMGGQSSIARSQQHGLCADVLSTLGAGPRGRSAGAALRAVLRLTRGDPPRRYAP
ncbi:hypothetical protein BE17_44840 [Sorangium cellulosum]|uniref:Uncharacterized protein n=1 Tax=Sorangium cellulosum TaxID=56 RepID=A0A150REL5_SORCE|nr:hypothetical protein BE17_44840 [Sorangium cellulosum]